MSHDIYIGQAEIRVPARADVEAGHVENDLRVVVETHDEPGAPEFPGDEMTGRGNHRHPAYSAWSEFCDATGLAGMFFDRERGLMREAPLTVALLPAHLAAVRAARERWVAARPDAVPGFGCDGAGREYDAVLARLLWLEYWIGWALATCEVPAIYNY
jgi:hypothetical protein